MTKTRGTMAVAALGVALLAALTTVPARGQMNEQAKRSMILTVEPLDLILKDLQVYDFAAGVGAPMRLHAYVLARKDDPEARKEIQAVLLKFVQGSPAPGGLMAACRALRLIGGPAAVPVLAGLVLKTETTDPARYALERIPGAEADQALLAALDQTKGDVRRGVVFSLGERGNGAAVPALTRLAAGSDAVLAADAIKALGKIGGLETTKILTGLLGGSGPALKPEIASALLLAAERRLKAGRLATSEAAYDQIFAANASAVSRQAAFKGQIATTSDPKALIFRALTGKESLLVEPALAAVTANFDANEIGKVADLMDRLSGASQVQLVTLLANYPADAVQSYLLKAAESPSLEVRLAALRAITAAGDGRSVGFLATRAARTAGAEQETAREALARIRGTEADVAVLEHLRQASDDAVKAELVRAASARRIVAATPVLIGLVKSDSPVLKNRAATALRTVCVQADIPVLLDLLGALDDETARESMEDTIAAVARANPRELARAGEVKTRLAAEKDAKKRGDLLRVLGKIGDDSALSMVRAALGDPDPMVVDAAVRALADWPTVTARDDVLGIAGSSTVLNHRVLATRAFVRMIGLEPNRAPEAATADLVKVLALSPRPEEKRLVLGALGRFPCPTSLKTAESFLADPAVAEEAKAAADRIRRSLR